jgi:hypothetical protein
LRASICGPIAPGIARATTTTTTTTRFLLPLFWSLAGLLLEGIGQF